MDFAKFVEKSVRHLMRGEHPFIEMRPRVHPKMKVRLTKVGRIRSKKR